MIDINTLKLGQEVKLPEGETGKVKAIDYDENVILVAVPVSNGVDIIDLAPDEPGFELVG